MFIHFDRIHKHDGWTDGQTHRDHITAKAALAKHCAAKIYAVLASVSLQYNNNMAQYNSSIQELTALSVHGSDKELVLCRELLMATYSGVDDYTSSRLCQIHHRNDSVTLAPYVEDCRTHIIIIMIYLLLHIDNITKQCMVTKTFRLHITALL